MPRFYFNLRDGAQFAEDEEGSELADESHELIETVSFADVVRMRDEPHIRLDAEQLSSRNGEKPPR